MAEGLGNKSINLLSADAANNELVIQLKKLRKKISKLEKQRDQRIGQIKRESICKFKAMGRKVKPIVEGLPIEGQCFIEKSGQILVSCGQKPSQQTEPCENVTKTHQNQGIADYWKKVILSEYESSFTKTDKDLLDYLKELAIEQYSQTKISLLFGFREGHSSIPAGEYIKTVIQGQHGECIAYEGDIIPEATLLKTCAMKMILGEIYDVSALKCVHEFFHIACNELIPNSLGLYLKARKKQVFSLQVEYSSGQKEPLSEQQSVFESDPQSQSV